MTPLCLVWVSTPGVYASMAKSLVQEAGSDVKTPAMTTEVHARESVSACSEQLARFFPELSRVQIHAVLTLLRNGAGKIRESVLVEFAGADKAIFGTNLPLEFDDRVRLSQVEEDTQCDGTVVAVQYENECKAVAVQFAGDLRSWVKTS
jgi:hypothetical protein